MNTSMLLANEINLIKDSDVKALMIGVTAQAPDYFITIPASSSGKYHPKYALGEGGLLRHTKAAVKIAHELFRSKNPYEFTQGEQDIIIAALIAHDLIKNGWENTGHTVDNHPLLAAELVEKVYKNLNREKLCWIHEGGVKVLLDCIKSHMGIWDKGYLPTPYQGMERFVHMCDYLASRKFLHVDLD